MKNRRIKLSLTIMLAISFLIVACGKTSQNGTNETTSETLQLKEVLIGQWITASGGADSTARIFNFYESGIMDTYIGDTKEAPLTGCYELDGETLYMNTMRMTNPREYNTPFTVKSFQKNEIVVTASGKTITWKRYQ